MKLQTAFKLSALAMSVSLISVAAFAVTTNTGTNTTGGSWDNMTNQDSTAQQYVDLGSKQGTWDPTGTGTGTGTGSQGINGALRYDINGKKYYQITTKGGGC